MSIYVCALYLRVFFSSTCMIISWSLVITRWGIFFFLRRRPLGWLILFCGSYQSPVPWLNLCAMSFDRQQQLLPRNLRIFLGSFLLRWKKIFPARTNPTTKRLEIIRLSAQTTWFSTSLNISLPMPPVGVSCKVPNVAGAQRYHLNLSFVRGHNNDRIVESSFSTLGGLIYWYCAYIFSSFHLSQRIT